MPLVRGLWPSVVLFVSYIAAVLEAVRQVVEQPQPLPPKMLFTLAEASKVTGLPRSWLRANAAAQRVPSSKVSGRWLFSLADLEVIVAAHGSLTRTGSAAARHSHRA